MRVKVEPSSIILTLSRRNLMSLLHMLDEGRTQGALNGRDENTEILVQAQEDDVHYADRPAGSMSWERGEAPDVMLVTRESQPDHIECGTEDLSSGGPCGCCDTCLCGCSVCEYGRCDPKCCEENT